MPLNCAALPGELLEAELFGHARGAFTGAERDRQGKFEVADGGTLFLDEIGDMPLALQAKLLRVLEDAVGRAAGDEQRASASTSASSRPPTRTSSEAIAAKRFRSDLYYRLNTFEIHLPPLRERPGDIDVLAPLFLERFAPRDRQGADARLSDDALALLRGYDWPGNVRELRNLMERAAVLSTETGGDGAVLPLDDPGCRRPRRRPRAARGRAAGLPTPICRWPMRSSASSAA